MTDFGSTDAIFIADNILVMSGYDIDNGLGYINGIYSLCFEQFELMTNYVINCLKISVKSKNLNVCCNTVYTS